MAKSLNKVFLLGRTGKDPECRSTGGGMLVANVSLATDERYKDSDGNWQSKAQWHDLVAFGRTAEVIRDYVRKGVQLYVEGRLQTDSYEKEGQRVYRTKIVVNDVILLDKGQRHEESSTNSSGEISEEDIPF